LVFLVASFPLAFPPTTYTRSSSPHSCYMPRPSHPPRIHYSNNTCKELTIHFVFHSHFLFNTFCGYTLLCYPNVREPLGQFSLH
jgi:hypothetical protein